MKAFWIGLFIAAWVGIFVTAAKAHDMCAPCDFNNDGTVSVNDYAAFFAAYGKKLGEPGYNPKADFDGNGTVSQGDFGILLKFCTLTNR